MSDPLPSPAERARLSRVFLFVAVSDLVLGLVLAAIGVTQDVLALTIVGVVLALSGAAVAAWLIVRGSRPEQL